MVLGHAEMKCVFAYQKPAAQVDLDVRSGHELDQ